MPRPQISYISLSLWMGDQILGRFACSDMHLVTTNNLIDFEIGECCGKIPQERQCYNRNHPLVSIVFFYDVQKS